MDRTALFPPLLPRIRRYAAAFTGSAAAGDQWIEAALLSLLQNMDALSHDGPPTRLIDLLHILHRTSRADRLPVDTSSGIVGRLSHLDNDTRAVLLLRGLEDLATTDIAAIIGRREREVEAMHRRGLAALRDLSAVQANDKAA